MQKLECHWRLNYCQKWQIQMKSLKKNEVNMNMFSQMLTSYSVWNKLWDDSSVTSGTLKSLFVFKRVHLPLPWACISKGKQTKQKNCSRRRISLQTFGVDSCKTTMTKDNDMHRIFFWKYDKFIKSKQLTDKTRTTLQELLGQLRFLVGIQLYQPFWIWLHIREVGKNSTM